MTGSVITRTPSGLYISQHSGWVKACHAAGVTPTQHYAHDADALFAALARIRDDLGGWPSRAQYIAAREPTEPSETWFYDDDETPATWAELLAAARGQAGEPGDRRRLLAGERVTHRCRRPSRGGRRVSGPGLGRGTPARSRCQCTARRRRQPAGRRARLECIDGEPSRRVRNGACLDTCECCRHTYASPSSPRTRVVRRPGPRSSRSYSTKTSTIASASSMKKAVRK